MKVLVFFTTLLAIAMARNSFRSKYMNSMEENRTKLGIIDGKNASRNQFPYIVSLQAGNGLGDYAHFCGGSIVSANWILTACHCIFGDSTVDKRVVAGLLLLSEADSNSVGQQIRNMSKIIQHPLFPGVDEPSPHDIALILLDHPLQFTNSVKPIAIPRAGLVSRGFGYLAGWGITSRMTSEITVRESMVSDPLQWTYLPIIPESECKVILDDFLIPQGSGNDFDENFNLCSGNDKAYEQPCTGDSGGPYAIDGKVIGIVSWGVDKCGKQKLPSVYIKVSSFIDWITNNTNGEVRP